MTRISDGAVVAAVSNTETDPNCATLGTNGHAPLLIASYLAGVLLAGHAAAQQPLAWQRSALDLGPINLSVFDAFAESGFWGITFDDGSVRVVSSRDATDWSTIEPPGVGASYHSAARGNLLIYPSWSLSVSKNILKGWTEGSSPEELYSGTTNVTGVAMSDDTMAWIGVDGPDWLEGIYDDFRFHWSPIGRTSAEVQAIEGPLLPIVNSRSLLDVAGDFIAADGCWNQPDGARACRVVVVRRSTRDVFLLRAAEGKSWSLLALAPDEILLAENDTTPIDSTYVHRLTRIKSESFSAWHASP